MRRIMIGGMVLLALAGCGPSGEEETSQGGEAKSPEVLLMERLLDAKPGDVIEVPEGKLEFDRGLSLTADGVTLRGKGMDKSILSFRGQVAGAEGLLVTASDFTMEDLAIEDARGDALKVNEGNNITIRRIRTEWTDGPDKENGAYGIYPVQTTNMLIEDSVAIGASDAGIYVGQSKDVVVRNNRAEFNVAGIEIENTVNADVYGNLARNNAGGILVFNMPELKQAGSAVRVFRNTSVNNNTENFGKPGTAVATVPAGTGMIVNAHDRIEIFENRIADNKTANLIISSQFSSGYSSKTTSESFDPYPETIFIYGNEFSSGGDAPSTPELEALRVAVFGADGRLSDIIWDGFVNPEKLEGGVLPPSLRICVDNGEAQILNVDGPNSNADPKLDAPQHECEHPKLPPIDLGREN